MAEFVHDNTKGSARLGELHAAVCCWRGLNLTSFRDTNLGLHHVLPANSETNSRWTQNT